MRGSYDGADTMQSTSPVAGSMATMLPLLSLEQALAQGLQLKVDAQRQVLARHGRAVEAPVLVAALYAPVCVAQQYLHAFLPPELFLVLALHAELAYVVARLVVVVFVDVGLRHLGHVAYDVGGVRVLVLADAALLHVEAGEAEYLLLEAAELPVGNLAHEQLLGVTGVPGVLRAVLDGGHARVELLAGDANRAAELGRVEPPARLVHHHHDVVGRLVVDHEPALAVGDDAARGIVYTLKEGV